MTTSFIECTAISASLDNNASSSSLIKRPLPPILNKGESRKRSPSVFIRTIIQFLYQSDFLSIAL
ncbi:MAG: hypothetical protein ACJ0Q4_05780 [Gammaproteobacteria bacterium]